MTTIAHLVGGPRPSDTERLGTVPFITLTNQLGKETSDDDTATAATPSYHLEHLDRPLLSISEATV
jgi:hypothetical protein